MSGCGVVTVQDLGNGLRTVDWGLTTELFEYFGGTSESVTRFTNRNVQNQLVDAELPHGVDALVVAFRHLDR